MAALHPLGLYKYRAGHGHFLWQRNRTVNRSINLEGLTGVDLKSAANTLSVLATLVATVTFTAAFTLPGGYKSDGPDQGQPVLTRKGALKVSYFLIA